MKRIITFTLAIILCCFSCKKDENGVLDNTPVQYFPGVSIANQSAATFNCFLTFDSCKVLTINEAKLNQSKVDLIFLHNNPDDWAMLVSPASIASATTIKPLIYTDPTYGVTSWTAKNSIQIGITDISVADFTEVDTNGELHSAYENDAHVTIGWEIDIKPNRVYKFTSNRTGKRGLIKVNSINGNYSSPGNIVMDIKMIN